MTFSVHYSSFFFILATLILLCGSERLVQVEKTTTTFTATNNNNNNNNNADSAFFQEEDDYATLSFDKIMMLLNDIREDSLREDVGLELASLLFDSEESLREKFPQFKRKSGILLTKQEMLNEYVNNVMPSILLSRPSTPSLSQQDDSSSLLVTPNNSAHCVKCVTLKNLAILMCNQHYPVAPGTCVECSFLRNLTRLLCNVTCEVTGSPPRPCIKCGIYYDSISMLCGPPNCTMSMGPYYKVPNDPELGIIDLKRSLGNSQEINAAALAPSNCIPCYNLYTGYQLVCGDLFDYCPVTPPPSPSVSATPLPPIPTTTATPAPSPSESSTPSPSISESSTPSASVSATPSPSISESPSASNTPSPSISESPSASTTPSASISESPSASPSVSPSISESISASNTPSTVPTISAAPSPSASASEYNWYYYYYPNNDIEEEEGKQLLLNNDLANKQFESEPQEEDDAQSGIAGLVGSFLHRFH